MTPPDRSVPEPSDRDDGWIPDVSALRDSPADPTRPADPADPADSDGDGGVPVDPPLPPRPGLFAPVAGPGQRRPVLPGWARSAAGLRAAAGWVAGYYSHAVLFHTVRIPVYLARLLGRVPRGMIRVVGRTSGWIFDAEGRAVRAAAVRREDSEQYLKLSRQRDHRVRLRLLIVFLGAVPLGIAVLALVAALPGGVRWFAFAVAVVGLGIVGAPAGQPLLGPAVVPAPVTRLTGDIVIRALESLGIAEINKAKNRGGGITFPAPITRDGPGWRADVDLPYGVTVSDILERRERLASGLRRPVGCVWPEPAHDAHAGRLVLWVGDQDMATAPAALWPLARRGQVDLFAPVPFGIDPRGRTVSVTLIENNLLIGSLPGAGKTATVRVLMLGCALDPTCELWVFNLKGTADLDAALPVAHRYATGLDDATVATVLGALRDLRATVGRRASALKNLPKDLCPDGKTTRRIAGVRTLGLHPLVMIVDECQNLFAHPVYGAEAGELATDVIKLGRALGIILILATQRPDAGSLPTGVSANVSIRFCLRVMGQVENDMILGTSMYRNGIRATTLHPRDRGIGYLVGTADTPFIVRSAYLDAPAAERVADRARAARAAAGTLAGHAAGETDADVAPTFSLCADILAVVPPSEVKVWSETVVERLAELRPTVYAGWGAEQLAAALKPFGIDTIQIGRRIDGRIVNRRGIDRARIAEAVTQSNIRRGPEGAH